jgi:hypothetical protein
MRARNMHEGLPDQYSILIILMTPLRGPAPANTLIGLQFLVTYTPGSTSLDAPEDPPVPNGPGLPLLVMNRPRPYPCLTVRSSSRIAIRYG